MGWVVIGLILLPRFGRAHTPGLSVAEFSVGVDGHVEAHLSLASAEVPGDDLRAFVVDGVDVSADDMRCAATYRGASPAGPDGIALDAAYACPPDAAEIAVTLYYLADLPRGHREVARIVAAGATAEAILTSDRRRLVLQLPNSLRPPRHRSARLLALIAIPAALALAWAVLRKRSPRL
jgi:hypothetical protein